ncbi:MAG: Wadjet anti-phage system protein JetD domain-containing protein [Gammaproteobacteria bacterium]
MISPEDIRAKATKHWTSQRVLRAWLEGEALFPLRIAFRAPSARELSDDFESKRQALKALHRHSKAQCGHGYVVDYKLVHHRQLGEQRLPCEIRFDTPEDLSRFVGKAREFERFKALSAKILAAEPGLRPWLAARPLRALALEASWPGLLAAVGYFREHPRPGRYLRELDVPGLDTKFLESHKSTLSALLDLVLPASAIDAAVTSLGGSGFERRYGLRYDEPRVRFRFLDGELRRTWRAGDLTLPLSEFQSLGAPCSKVFVTENKVNGLAFPDIDGAMVVFGLGYGIRSLSNVDWLRECTVHYWGDLDTHGFAILSTLRERFPHTHSFLMDEATLLEHRGMWGAEEQDKRHLGELTNLNAGEKSLFDALRLDAYGTRVRLEQERIRYAWLSDRLRRIEADEREA